MLGDRGAGTQLARALWGNTANLSFYLALGGTVLAHLLILQLGARRAWFLVRPAVLLYSTCLIEAVDNKALPSAHCCC